MATVHSTGRFPELLWEGIANIWGQKYKSHPKLYKKYFREEKSNKAFEKEQGFTRFQKAALKEEGGEIAFATMFQGLQKEYRHYTYGIGAVVTQEMVEDDQYNVISGIPAMLAESMIQLKETLCANQLNNGFSSNIGADGVALFAATHPLIAIGGTASNQPSVAADLSQTSLEQATTDIMTFLDDQGLQIQVNAKTLVVPPALHHTAHKLLETQMVVGSADNDKNIVANMGIEPVTNPFLTDTDAWFLVTDIPNGLTIYTRRAAKLDRDGDFETDNLKIKTTERFSIGFTDWRGVYGSAGA